jgi:hypothetical protein
MGKDKLIKTTQHHIHILDHKGLALLADGRKRLA